MLGSTLPRIYTPPLIEGPPGPCGCGCALTDETSYGFDVIEFARDVLEEPLDPWEAWAVIHGGELLPDGRPRFRKLLILVARQNGKTHLLRVLKLFWLFIHEQKMILGISTDRNYAKKQWVTVCDQAKSIKALRALLPAHKNAGVCTQIGDEHIKTLSGCEYRIAAPNRRAGRSLSIDRLVMDELREHDDWDTWNAAYNAMNARPYGQAFCITNQGDDRAVVLDSLRSTALQFIKTGKGDSRLGLLEWSAPDGCEVDDLDALAQANPNLGRRIGVDDLLSEAARVKEKGGREEADFRTENMCQRIRALDAAIDPQAWEDCAGTLTLADLTKPKIAMCLDLSLDRRHATLVAAAVSKDGQIVVETLAAWDGSDTTTRIRRDLPALLEAWRPRRFGYMPNGAAATLVADLKPRKGQASWAPWGCQVVEITSEVTAVCMGFADMVESGGVVHHDEELLNDHVTGAERLMQGERWRFRRTDGGYCDGAYAAAGATHLVRTLPTVNENLDYISIE